jgi:hypothetical protein
LKSYLNEDDSACRLAGGIVVVVAEQTSAVDVAGIRMDIAAVASLPVAGEVVEIH